MRKAISPCALPSEDRRGLRARRPALHRAGARPPPTLGRGPVACLGAALQDARQALPGEPDGECAGEDVQARRCVGHGADPA